MASADNRPVSAPHRSQPEGGSPPQEIAGAGGSLLEEVLGLREEIVALAARHGAGNVRIFGSVARGTAGPESDVDFLVEMEPGRSLFDLGGLTADLHDLLGRRVDVVTERALSRFFRDRVIAEARPL